MSAFLDFFGIKPQGTKPKNPQSKKPQGEKKQGKKHCKPRPCMSQAEEDWMWKNRRDYIDKDTKRSRRSDFILDKNKDKTLKSSYKRDPVSKLLIIKTAKQNPFQKRCSSEYERFLELKRLGKQRTYNADGTKETRSYNKKKETRTRCGARSPKPGEIKWLKDNNFSKEIAYNGKKVKTKKYTKYGEDCLSKYDYYLLEENQETNRSQSTSSKVRKQSHSTSSKVSKESRQLQNDDQSISNEAFFNFQKTPSQRKSTNIHQKEVEDALRELNKDPKKNLNHLTRIIDIIHQNDKNYNYIRKEVGMKVEDDKLGFKHIDKLSFDTFNAIHSYLTAHDFIELRESNNKLYDVYYHKQLLQKYKEQLETNEKTTLGYYKERLETIIEEQNQYISDKDKDMGRSMVFENIKLILENENKEMSKNLKMTKDGQMNLNLGKLSFSVLIKIYNKEVDDDDDD